jgi:nucleotide-binding universal stress UspA family protein
MYKKMLIPLDRSEVAEVVFPHAKEVAGRLGLEVVLLHVVGQEERDRTSSYQPYLDGVAESLLNQAHYVLRSAGPAGGKSAVHVHATIAVGNPAEKILDYAEQNKVDLIMMATHGRSGISRWAMGSVADKVLRRSSVPVWLIQAAKPESAAADTWPKMTMLVPLDGSKLAESVLPHVEALAKQRGAKPEVVLVRAFEPLSTGPGREAPQQYLSGIEQRLSAAGLTVRSEVLEGDPAKEIVDYANEKPINLVVMATHGRSGIGRWAYGSVADKVLRRASRPVFLVRVAEASW